MPHRCKKILTLAEEIAALRASVRKGGRHRQLRIVPRRSSATADREVMQAVVSCAVKTDAPEVLAAPHDLIKKDSTMNDAESTVDDNRSVVSCDSGAVQNNTSVPLTSSQTAARYLWTQVGIDSLKRQGRWGEYDSPEAGHEVKASCVQALLDAGKLGVMAEAKYFVVEEVEVVEKACEVCAMDDSLSMPAGIEDSGADANATGPSPTMVTTLAPPIPLQAGDDVARYLWTDAGIDSLRKQNMWEAYGSPEAGNEVEALHLQLLRDTDKLGAMVSAKFFLDTEEVEVKGDGAIASDAKAISKKSCPDWEPPCMMCQSCNLWWSTQPLPTKK